jgi:hypothetical protein
VARGRFPWARDSTKALSFCFWWVFSFRGVSEDEVKNGMSPTDDDDDDDGRL